MYDKMSEISNVPLRLRTHGFWRKIYNRSNSKENDDGHFFFVSDYNGVTYRNIVHMYVSQFQ